jgi:hypothetical protein
LHTFGYAVGRVVNWVEMGVEVERGVDVDVACTSRRMKAVTRADSVRLFVLPSTP